VSVARFTPCDPDQPPATELLAEMAAELNALYFTASRLDLPPVHPSELRPPDGVYLVGWEGDHAVAGGALRHFGEGLAEIKRMFVRPAARSRGVAGELLTSLEDAARLLGYRRLRLDTGPKQVHALALYRREGYVPIEPYNGNPFACFWGEKEIGPAQGAGAGRA
jgi:GNAT superfamily N-acetyltransferase